MCKCIGLVWRRLCINGQVFFLETVMYKCTGLVWRLLCINVQVWFGDGYV